MSAGTLILRYSAFALVAGLSQRLVLAATTHPSRLALAVAVGTGAGLVVKYMLDKKWIFADTSRGARAHARRFGVYSLMGLFTTLLFWGMELGFWTYWKTDLMREVGAALGLAIGYVAKYHLDKRFVFDPRPT